MRRSIVLMVATVMVVAVTGPATADRGGVPANGNDEGRAFGAAVSAAATSGPGAVSGPASAGHGPAGEATPGSDVAAARSSRPAHTPGNPMLLALGDSWAQGQGATDPGTGGYVARLHAALLHDLDCLPAQSENAADGCKHLQLLNLGRQGDATNPGVTAPLVAAEQLPIALPLLEKRNGDANPRNDVEAITLHVGGNDVSGPIQAACLDGFVPDPCITTWIAEMSAYEADLRDVVGRLRAAAGDDTPIVLGTYDNPVRYCWLFGVFGEPAVTLGEFVLEGLPDGSLDGIHDIVRRIAAEFDAEVAEVFGQFVGTDFVGGDDCFHMTDGGHDKTTSAFLALLAS